MSLYYEAAAILANSDAIGGSLKSRIYSKKDGKSSPGQIFGLIAETSKWSVVLKDVIDRCGMLREEKKLTPVLALLLAHDLLLAKSGVAAPPSHVLRLAITRHKARLNAELTKARLRWGYATLDAFREAVENDDLEKQHDDAPRTRHPRWVRVNTIKTTLHQLLSTTFSDFKRTESIDEVLHALNGSRMYFVDPNIPHLLAVPSTVNLSKTSAYLHGHIILQDKASCFPAYLLDPKLSDGDVIDGTAAPGNKTTHLAAILSSQETQEHTQKVFAFERDKSRTLTLQKMVKLASATEVVVVKGESDFLAAKHGSPEFANVGAILLDPSCSGSGMIGRDDVLEMLLPNPCGGHIVPHKPSRGAKRKRCKDTDCSQSTENVLRVNIDDALLEKRSLHGSLSERLTALSSFQLRILTHAMQFPNARKITYSTCSIHFEENEGVVFQALASSIARERGWDVLRREDQVEGLQKWPRRGTCKEEEADCDMLDETKRAILDACIRCDKGGDDGTMGFFVVAFIRRDSAAFQLKETIIDDSIREPYGSLDDEQSNTSQRLAVTNCGKKKRKKHKGISE